MRISNIDQYLGGADNVIAREIIEGDQQSFQFKLGTQDFSSYRFNVTTELLKAEITKRGSSIKINNLTPVSQLDTTVASNQALINNLMGNGVHEYQNSTQDPNYGDGMNQDYTDLVTNGGIVLDQHDATLGNLIVSSDMLSNLTSDHAPADSNNPFVVSMSVTLNSMTTINIKQTFRMLWIVRYRPTA